MFDALRPRGFSQFAFVEHRGEFIVVKWDDATVPAGAMGNLVFLHDRVADRLLSAVLVTASSLAERAVAVGEMYATAANERSAVIESLQRVCELRLQLIEKLSDARTGEAIR